MPGSESLAEGGFLSLLCLRPVLHLKGLSLLHAQKEIGVSEMGEETVELQQASSREAIEADPRSLGLSAPSLN